MAIRDTDVLSDAMIATEKEIAADAWDKNDTGEDADPSGDRALETMGEGLEGQHEPDEGEEGDESEAEEAEGDESEEGDDEGEGEGDEKPPVKANGEDKSKPPAKAQGDAKPEPEHGTKVLSGKLRESNERGRTLEAERDDLKKQLGERDAKYASDLAAMRAQIETLTTLVRQPSQPAKDAAKPDAEEEMPEVLENPRGFADFLVRKVQAALAPVSTQTADIRLETSFAIAHAVHKDVFTQAWDAINKLDPRNPEDRATVQRIRGAANPGEALIGWHKRNVTLAEVGDDPAAYRERLAKETRESLMKDPEFRKQILADLRQEAETANDGKPRHQLRLPPNLNGAAGRGTSRDVTALDGSEQGIADSAWG